MNTQPLAFLDVDGVLNRDVSLSVARTRGYFVRHVDVLGFSCVPLILDPVDAARLAHLRVAGYELAWGTTWEQAANEHISPLLGLSRDLLVAVNRSASASKATGIIEAAAGRDFIWFDDEASEADAAAVSEASGTLIRIEDPGLGLTDTHLETARQLLIQHL